MSNAGGSVAITNRRADVSKIAARTPQGRASSRDDDYFILARCNRKFSRHKARGDDARPHGEAFLGLVDLFTLIEREFSADIDLRQTLRA